jgi:hypothetical protein
MHFEMVSAKKGSLKGVSRIGSHRQSGWSLSKINLKGIQPVQDAADMDKFADTGVMIR